MEGIHPGQDTPFTHSVAVDSGGNIEGSTVVIIVLCCELHPGTPPTIASTPITLTIPVFNMISVLCEK